MGQFAKVERHPINCGSRVDRFILGRMFGMGNPKPSPPPAAPVAPAVSKKLCTDRFNGKYPHVGLYDCKAHKVWICKPLAGQAIRQSHASLITGSNDPTSTVWKDRFLCFWFYTPGSGEGYIGARLTGALRQSDLLVRIDPNWDYDRQRFILEELTDQVESNLERQIRHGQEILRFFAECRLSYPISLHYIAQRAAHSTKARVAGGRAGASAGGADLSPPGARAGRVPWGPPSRRSPASARRRAGCPSPAPSARRAFAS